MKKLERELSFRRELASLGEMSAGIAHEFRNATAAILGYARLAGTADDPESRQRHLARIRAEAEHVARVTGDFLLFARPERLQVAPVDLSELVDEVVAEGRATSPAARFSVEGDLPVRDADAALLRRALVNLVRNAAEAAGEAGRILVRGESTPDGAFVLTVEDSGPGIAPEAVAEALRPLLLDEGRRHGPGALARGEDRLPPRGERDGRRARTPSAGPRSGSPFRRAPLPAADEDAPEPGSLLDLAGPPLLDERLEVLLVDRLLQGLVGVDEILGRRARRGTGPFRPSRGSGRSGSGR